MITRLKLTYPLIPPTVVGNSASSVANALTGETYQVFFTADAGTALPAPGADLELYYRFLVGHPHVKVSAHRPQRTPLLAGVSQSDPITTVLTFTNPLPAPEGISAMVGAGHTDQHNTKGTR